MRQHIGIIIFAIMAIGNALSVYSEVVDTNVQIFDPNFRTLQVKVAGNDQLPPIIVLDSNDRIIVSFDELNEDVRYMRYSVVHCNADWQPSALVESEYIDGFNFGNVEDTSFSSGTFAHYVHYRISLPNKDMRLLKSGNYLLKVYAEDNPDETLLQARFSVCEKEIDVMADVTSRTDIDYNSNSQQVSVKVATRNYEVRDLYSDLKLYVSQNSRPDNEIMISRPLIVGRGSAVFEHNKSLIFPAGNEFRRFEVVSTNYPGMRVENIEYHNPYYHATLYTDKVRTHEPYTYDSTQHGRYTVRELNATNSDVSADYVVVHFSLDAQEMHGGRLYLNGDFTRHQFTPSTMMKYNGETGRYELDIMLKQGSYNYQYLWVPDGSNVGFTEATEGNHYQTVNEYLIKVYHRPQGERYDRFIGFAMVFSGR
ncbi:MAG: DUF5103 domain-containing protein [Muribaculaceae bacterium]